MIATLGACALALAAQAAQGASIVGTVRVAGTGEPLAGALVILTDIERATVTGADGRYELLDVAPGPAHIVVEHPGHVSALLHVLVPSRGRLRLDVAVAVAPIELRELVVTQTRPVRGLDPDDGTSFPNRGISAAALRTHPGLAEPDVLRALAGGEVVVDPEAPIGVHVRGGATDHVAYLLDGIPVLNPVHTAGMFSAWNPDAVAGIRLISAAPSRALPDALAGVIVATTRVPNGRTRVQGALSNTQGRVTVDGPAGIGDVGYVVSLRMGFPGPIGGEAEPSYLSGEAVDVVAAVERKAFGGSTRLLFYDAENEIGSAREVLDESAGLGAGVRNGFSWQSRSLGATWTRAFPEVTVRIAAWSARAATAADWNASAGRLTGVGTLGEEGAQLAIERRTAHATSELGVRLRRLRSGWTAATNAGVQAWSMGGSSSIGQVYVEHARNVARTLEAHAGASASAALGSLHLAPRLELRWRAAARLAWTAAYARTQQFTQSVRNDESVVGHIFPADIFLAADGDAVPVPRGDQVVLAGEWTAAPGVRVAAQAYVRRARGLLLVAPADVEPVATRPVPVGGTSTRGAALDLAVSRARYGVVASYGWQNARMTVGGATYTPRHAAAHLFDAGAILYPSATSSVRASLTVGIGRRGTVVAGPFEWEACNLLDRGCEFAGSPRLAGVVGADVLPRYVRVDLGARKHWHLRVRGRHALLGVFGTVTNVLGRANVLAHVIDPATGERAPVRMLPRAPLSVGLDWRF